MPPGWLSPEISEAFTSAPDVVYSEIVCPMEFATNRSCPDTAMASGLPNPEIREAFTSAPDVVYSLTVPAR